MPDVLRTAAQATPVWLTAVLRRAGVVPVGHVVAVEHQGNPAFNSAITHLVLTYTPDAPDGTPRQLLLKRNQPSAWGAKAGAREVAFYRLIASVGAPEALSMLVRCYDAAYDERSGDSHLLLHDLSASHRPPLTRSQIVSGDSVPSRRHAEQVVDALSRFHAYWWDHPLLSSGAVPLAPWCDGAAGYERVVQRRRQEWGRFLAAEGAWFPAELRSLYEHALAGARLLWERYLARRVPTSTESAVHRTLTHNDCYFSNWLCPSEPAAGPACLIDWQSPAVSLGPGDLVPLCATFATPAQRQRGHFEDQVLRRYHAGLVAHGVRGYSWDALLTDYKLGVIDWLYYPVWDQTNGTGRAYWWPKLQCLTGAFADLHCAELLA